VDGGPEDGAVAEAEGQKHRQDAGQDEPEESEDPEAAGQ